MGKKKPFDVEPYRDLLHRCEVAFLADVEYAIPAGRVAAFRARKRATGQGDELAAPFDFSRTISGNVAACLDSG